MKTVFFDTETTGVDTQSDRIIQIAVLLHTDDGQQKRFCTLINPGMPIPKNAVMVHGITDTDVAKAPPFRNVAEKLFRLFSGVALAGYNIKRFDIPLLIAEFRRAGLDWDPEDVPIVDVFEIFCAHEGRTLSDAVRFYCGESHDSAHDAMGDVIATSSVLKAMIIKYNLMNSMEVLSATYGSSLGWDGKLALTDDGTTVFTFGKHRGADINQVAKHDPGWVDWALANQVFCRKNMAVLRRALNAAESGK